MKNLLIKCLSVLFLTGMFVTKAQAASAGSDTLHVYYYENYPFAYKENGVLKGIEVDIVKEYATWIQTNKGTSLFIDFKGFREFGDFYTALKKAKSNCIGLGSATITGDRVQEISFSAPYMKNVSLLITNGTVISLKTKTPEEVLKVLGDKEGLALSNSYQIKYLDELKRDFLPFMKIRYVDTDQAILDSVGSNPKYIGYMDIVTCWTYIRKNRLKPIKIQKVFNQGKERFGFLFPLQNKHSQNFEEFLDPELDNSFVKTERYLQILQMYLSAETAKSIAID